MKSGGSEETLSSIGESVAFICRCTQNNTIMVLTTQVLFFFSSLVWWLSLLTLSLSKSLKNPRTIFNKPRASRVFSPFINIFCGYSFFFNQKLYVSQTPLIVQSFVTHTSQSPTPLFHWWIMFGLCLNLSWYLAGQCCLTRHLSAVKFHPFS